VRLAVIGDIAWDIFIRPEHDLVPGSDVFGTVDVMPGGAAANVAVWSRRLGLSVALRGKIGDDTLGQVMQTHLRTEGVASHLQVVPGGFTTRVGILVSADGEHSFVMDHTKVLRFGAGDVPVSVLDGASAVFFNGYDIYLARSTAFLQPVLAEARRRGVPVIFDPSSFALIRQYGPERLLNDVGPLDVLIANEDEARVLAPAEGLQALRRHAQLLVVKQGARGAAALDDTGWTREPAVPITVVDTTGAGDAFDAAFMAEWLASHQIASALRAGNRLGAHVAAHMGGQPVPPTPALSPDAGSTVTARPTPPTPVS
jgi:sugar/nucleoside kinase (ribokinase family)